MRSQLLKDFSFNESTIILKLGLSSAQTPDVVADLNASGHALIDPIAYGLVLPDKHLARLSLVELKKLEFDPAGPQLSDTTNVIISLQPAHTGTMRKAEALYSVYSDEPLKWSWTYLASGEIRPSKPSQGSEDILNMILGNGAEKIKQKVALPPVWSDLQIRVSYSPELPFAKRPRITRLYFEFGCDVSSAPELQCVVNVQSLGTTDGAVIQCSPDLAKRADGFQRMIRIYPRGAEVNLSVPTQVGGAAFDAWDLVGNQINDVGVKTPGVKLTLNDNVLAQCHWNRLQVRQQRGGLARSVAPEDVSGSAANRADDVHEGEESQPAETQARDLPLRVEAAENATVLGVVPTLQDAELVEEGKDGWKAVNYRGVVGWVSTSQG